MGASHVGLQARLMSQALRKLAGVIAKSNCVAIFINQLRDKVGVIYGNPETTTGGRALKFYASVRMDIRKGEAIKNGTEIIGNNVKCKIVKNKVAPPFKVASFEILYGEGISRYGELVDLGAQFDIIKKSGTWFSYGENRIGQGKENAKQFLRDNPDIADEVERRIREKLAGESQASEETTKKPADKNAAAKTAASKPVSDIDVSADDFE